MRSAKPKTGKNRFAHWTVFVSLFILALIIQGVFFASMVRWTNVPDIGWTPGRELGPNVVMATSELGEKEGLIRMDNILKIDGQPYDTFDEMIALTSHEVGHIYEYTIERNGNILTISIPAIKLGWGTVIMWSGVFWLLGIVFIVIGAIVFLMKPHGGPSWSFFMVASITGIFITYMSPSDVFKPSWLNNIMLIIPPFLPAAFLSLAMLFPERRAWFADRKLSIIAPYLVSLILAIFFKSSAPRIAVVPDSIITFFYTYLLLSVLTFLSSTIISYFRSKSIAVRLQSLVIFTGMTIAMFIPLIELSSNYFLQLSLLPNPIIFYLFFLTAFPLSIGYAIVKHDLFAIDVFVRRTYGYILSTAVIIGSYALIVSVLNFTFHSSEVSKSPMFSIVFALSIVFFFRPIHERFQRFIDRVFYRQRYDYRKTIKDISKAMTSILDPQQIHRTLIGSVVKEMFLENGLLLLPNPSENIYHARAIESGDAEKLRSIKIRGDDELLKVIEKKNDAVFRTEVDLNPRYDNNREVLQQTFQSFDSELMLPMKYKNEMRGIISLGGKKSGKLFTPEDIDLIKTLTSQSIIALENAKLFQENLEKGRMEEELKIAHDIQTSMLPETAPTIEGFKIAATSIPAKEVGGDFYDFHNISGEEKMEKLGIVVGDVSGKAVSGALVMAASRSIFRVLSETSSSIEEIMKKGNARLKSDVKKGMFVALLYAVLDSRERTITLSNAGQTQPILCSDDKKPFYIETDGDRFPLGIVKGCDYQKTKVQLTRGDKIILYTDGVVEAMNDKKEMYGFDRFISSIDEGRNLDSDSLLRKLTNDLSNFVRNVEQHDDITIVIVHNE